MKKLMVFPIYAFLLCLLMGCGGSVGRAPSQALTIVSLAPPDGTLGSTYAGTQGFSFSATGGVAPYVWSWTAAAGSSLPPGLSLFSDTGVVSGTPTTVGVYHFTVSVRDSSSPAIQTSVTYPITVIAPAALGITSPNPPDATLGADYGGVSGYSLRASGGIAPYTWGWVATAGSSLPPGLTLSPDTGVISGIATTTGSYNFAITVSDSESPPAQSSVGYTLSVSEVTGLTITSGTLPSGTVGTPYGGFHIVQGHQVPGFPLGATDGTPPYTWTWAAAPASSLPPGLKIAVLAFEGSTRCCLNIPVVNGTPTAAGAYDVVVTVTDSATPSGQASASYTIVIKP